MTFCEWSVYYLIFSKKIGKTFWDHNKLVLMFVETHGESEASLKGIPMQLVYLDFTNGFVLLSFMKLHYYFSHFTKNQWKLFSGWESLGCMVNIAWWSFSWLCHTRVLCHLEGKSTRPRICTLSNPPRVQQPGWKPRGEESAGGRSDKKAQVGLEEGYWQG